VGAVDVCRLLGREKLYDRLEVLYGLIKSSPLMKGFQEVLIPGEPEARQAALRGSEGIPLPEEVIESLKVCGQRMNVASPFGD
ncbi:MAG TPA: Ldh family oxidoreductase, partial [Spirochaetia bacterium]|nr:Ldh family oxidoreductase [Spirochaetia bacterium]